jgi:ubiquinone/menaquinone biosynthesis C-methylase UbiE
VNRRAADIVSRLVDNAGRVVRVFEALEPDQLEAVVHADESGWRAIDLLAHLVTIEQSMHWLFNTIVAGGEGSPRDFDVDRFNRSQVAKLHGVSRDDLLARFRAVRAGTIWIIEPLTDADLDRVGWHPVHGSDRLEVFLRWAYLHADRHVADLQRLSGLPQAQAEEPVPDRPAPGPIAHDAYETLAERYAALVDTKPHNAYYDRPAVISLLPEVRGLRVLDAGCGPGAYAEWLVEHGAQVVAVDASPAMLAHARQRVSDRATFHLADLSQPLDFLEDGSFDLVIAPLVLDYLEDWRGVLGELRRVLKPGGVLVFSCGHPMADYLYYQTASYFNTERVSALWRGFGGTPVEVPMFRRPLGAILDALLGAGFALEKLLEPLPTEAFRRAEPEDFDRLMRQPGFMVVRARAA